jgi:Putative prokaryotic signal transducing protein
LECGSLLALRGTAGLPLSLGNWAYNRPMEHPNLVVIQTCGNPLNVELVKGALEAAGIPAILQADSVGRMREHLAWSGEGFKVLVREEDAAAAREALAPPVGTLEVDSTDFPETDSETDRDHLPPWRRFT